MPGNVFSLFLPNFAQIAAHFNHTLRDDQLYIYSELFDKQLEVFHTVQEKLISRPVLGVQDERHTYGSYRRMQLTDVMHTPQQENRWKIKTIGFWSWLTDAKGAYDTTEKECVPIIWAVVLFLRCLKASASLLSVQRQARMDIKSCRTYWHSLSMAPSASPKLSFSNLDCTRINDALPLHGPFVVNQVLEKLVWWFRKVWKMVQREGNVVSLKMRTTEPTV